MLASESTGNIISPDGSLVVIFFLFLIFVFLLNRILFKPVGRILDQREKLTHGAKAEAREAADELRRKLGEFEERIRLARAESYRYLEQQRAAAVARRNQDIEEARHQAASTIEDGKREIARQAEQARSALESEAASIAGSIAQTILGRAVGGGGD